MNPKNQEKWIVTCIRPVFSASEDRSLRVQIKINNDIQEALRYRIEDIATIVKGRFLARYENTRIENLLIDSRKLIFPGSSLFFALRGARRDGHTFLEELYKKGVKNFVVMDSSVLTSFNKKDVNIIHVEDTLQALQQLGAAHRKSFNIPVIGITGSNGKTIVKEWLNQLLEEDYQIVRSPRSYNSQIGVPLSVWAMNENHQLAIFEAGISQSGEMSNLRKIIEPTIGIFTNIGEAHSEGFINKRQKVNEKLQLFIHAKTLIYCKDQPSLNEAVGTLWNQLNREEKEASQIFGWSYGTDADLQILEVHKENGSTQIIASRMSEKISIRIPFTDNASIENAIHCWCLMLLLGIPSQTISERMLKLNPVAMRLELKNGINNTSVINDSYNADLNSLKIALDFLGQQHQHPRKTVVLSDLLQTGRNEKDLYEEVGQLLQLAGVDRVIAIGERIQHYRSVFSHISESFFYPSTGMFRQEFHRHHFGDEIILLKGARVFEFEQIDKLLEQKVHQTVMEINLNALVSNLKIYQGLLAPSTKLMAMVKAFSYGSGSFEIANVLQFHGIDYLAVAYTDEGVALRKAGITLPVMVMNTDEAGFDALIQYGLEPDIYSRSLLNAFESYLRKQAIRQFPVHIELETGMNRLGFSEAELPGLLKTIGSELLRVKSVFSHLSASEDPQHDGFTARQAERFRKMTRELEQALGYEVIKHISNSSCISRHPELQFDMVRLGIGLYGIDTGMAGKQGLREVSVLRSTIAQIKHIEEGETVGYGRKGIADKKMRIATIRIGYADGYPRSLGNGVGKVMVHGKPAPTMGSVCMDMTMIDITDIPPATEGDEVILFGPGLSVSKLAEWADTIPYEILTGISQRVKRVYYED
jgi:alanine racemase